MKYLSILDSYPKSATYGKTVGLARFEGVIYQRFDRNRVVWVDDLELLGRISGLGGDPGYVDFKEITKEEAQAIVQKWGGNL